MKIFSKFCGLLRIYELYLSLVPKDRGKPKMYILSPNHDIVSYLTQTNNLGTTFYAIFMPSRSRSNCIFGLWVKSKILGSSHFALSESDLNALHFLEYNWFEEKWMKNSISLSKLFWPTVRKKCSSVQEKTLEIWDWRPRICKLFDITRTLYSNSEWSEQFLNLKKWLRFRNLQKS